MLTGVFHERIEYPDVAIPARSDASPASEPAANAEASAESPQASNVPVEKGADEPDAAQSAIPEDEVKPEDEPEKEADVHAD